MLVRFFGAAHQGRGGEPHGESWVSRGADKRSALDVFLDALLRPVRFR